MNFSKFMIETILVRLILKSSADFFLKRSRDLELKLQFLMFKPKKL